MENIKYEMRHIIGFDWFIGYNNGSEIDYAKNILIYGENYFFSKIIPTQTYGRAIDKYDVIKNTWDSLIINLSKPNLLSDYIYCPIKRVFIPRRYCDPEDTLVPMPHGVFFSLTE